MSDMTYARQCSRWNNCSVNCCPLDPFHRERPSISGDPERTCLSAPAERVALVALAAKDGLHIPDGGLTIAEREGGLSADQLQAEWQSRRDKRRENAISRFGHARNRTPGAETSDPASGYLGTEDSDAVEGAL